MRLMITGRRRAAPGPGVEGRFQDIVWPLTFPEAPRARVHAYALAVLVVVASMCAAFKGFYWADDPQVSQHREGLGGLTQAMVWPFKKMAVPLLLMCAVLAGALRSWPRKPYRVLAAVAWPVSALAIFVVVLDTSLTNDADYCTGNAPVDPVSWNMVALCLVAALAAGSLAGWIAWVVSGHRARPIALYAVWLATIAATVVLTLVMPLHAAQTCGPPGIG
ncbi:hypothetical protein ACOT81_00220 [Streptomyces sp. WI04-05B]|uniref:hypothetical protein n=1 Tax=Streptomyces TaxID=1883 RepID=UPI0029B45F3E|nr:MULTISPECIES: hypothetical protein [unclassified Streptomyces]MDX2548894.1 hypothetical protein [Streptomyces sp. WI04-05B]MDX2590511.1 hypothetical protein [Streptomyces sp. WI04-05A]MDX3745703.1 hypothetical protein [Streptomyces sp. AK08-02]